MKNFFLLILAVIFNAGISFADVYQVTSAKLNVRNQPSVQGKLIGSLERGIEVNVLDISNDFAKFNFMGKDGYASMKYLQKIEPKEKIEEPVQQIIEKTEPIAASAPKSNATIYIFLDHKGFFESFPININGEHKFGLEGKVISSDKNFGNRYSQAVRKINVHGEGQTIISYDVTWYGKPYHNEIAIDITDGGVYYIKLFTEKIFKALAKKRNGWEFKLLKQKDGLKELSDDKYVVNPEIDIEI